MEQWGGKGGRGSNMDVRVCQLGIQAHLLFSEEVPACLLGLFILKGL